MFFLTELMERTEKRNALKRYHIHKHILEIGAEAALKLYTAMVKDDNYTEALKAEAEYLYFFNKLIELRPWQQ